MNKAAVIQMVSSPEVMENFKIVEHYLIEAKNQDVSLVVLPENFAFMGLNEQDKLKHAEVFGVGDMQERLSALAKKFGIWIVAGTIPMRATNNKVRAASLVFDDKGKCAARYDKIHLFDVRVSQHEAHQESLTIEPGKECVVVDTPVGKIGLSVCYDLRFPELFRQLVIKGAELFTVSSAFTAITGVAHWEVLLRARAIENLCYVLAPNQGGHHKNERTTYGNSMIIEPWGKILAQKSTDGAGMVTAAIDLQRMQQLRSQFPCNDHHVLSKCMNEE